MSLPVIPTTIAVPANLAEIIHAQILAWPIHADQMPCAPYQIIVHNALVSKEWLPAQQLRWVASVHQHHHVQRIEDAKKDGLVSKNIADPSVHPMPIVSATSVVIVAPANRSAGVMMIAELVNYAMVLFALPDVAQTQTVRSICLASTSNVLMNAMGLPLVELMPSVAFLTM